MRDTDRQTKLLSLKILFCVCLQVLEYACSVHVCVHAHTHMGASYMLTVKLSQFISSSSEEAHIKGEAEN